MQKIEILNPIKDISLFKELLSRFKSRVKSNTYMFNNYNIDTYINWLIDKFITSDPKHFIVATVVEYEKIISFHIGCSLGTVWNDAETIPMWYYLLAYNEDRTLKIAGESIGRLGVVLMNHFENIRYYSFYATTRLPINLLNAENIDNYLDSTFQKNYPIFRYKRYIEQVIKNDSDLLQLKKFFKGYELLLPNKIHKPMVLMKYEMINSLRNFS